ncbi:MAG: cytochrome P450 [Gemmataceae bacterium]
MSLFELTHSETMARFAGIPGPPPSLPLGNAAELLERWPWEVAADWGRLYGGMALAWLGGTPAIVLNDPDLIGCVLDSESANYYKGDPHDAVAPVITPDELFISNGEQWKSLRSTSPLNRPYTANWLQDQSVSLRAFAGDSAEALVGQSADDLIEPIRRLVYDLISVAVWGEPLGDDNFNEFLKMARVGNRRLQEPPFLQQVPPLDPVFYLDRERWYAGFRERVEKVMADPSRAGNSLLGLALRAGGMSATDLAQFLSAGVYFGGVFSVSAGIAHTLRFLHREPRYLVELLKLDAVTLQGSESLDHALRESLRLSPPVTLWFRNVNRETAATLGGHTLPPGTLLFLTNWLLHRDPTYWTNAEEYRPERWANGGVERDPPGSGHFFPFGRGPRTCIGQDFAFVLMKLVLATLLSRTRLQLDLSYGLESDFFFAVQHPKKMSAKIEPKS